MIKILILSKAGNLGHPSHLFNKHFLALGHSFSIPGVFWFRFIFTYKAMRDITVDNYLNLQMAKYRWNVNGIWSTYITQILFDIAN